MNEPPCSTMMQLSTQYATSCLNAESPHTNHSEAGMLRSSCDSRVPIIITEQINARVPSPTLRHGGVRSISDFVHHTRAGAAAVGCRSLDHTGEGGRENNDVNDSLHDTPAFLGRCQQSPRLQTCLDTSRKSYVHTCGDILHT